MIAGGAAASQFKSPSVRWNAERSVGKVSDIHFSNILCRGENGVMVYAEEPDKLDGIEFDRVQVHIDKND